MVERADEDLGGERRDRWITPTILIVLAFVAAGAALRLSFPTDIEFKADERLLFGEARALAVGGPWPWVGPPSSVRTPEPPMTDWILGMIARLAGAATPPDLARCVQGLNVAALALFTAFAAWISRRRGEAWLWAAALWAVNPVAIILERKIWNPSLLPLPAVLFYMAWWFRRAPAAAFAWGALSAILAQIHPGAAFLAISLAAWTWVRERRDFPWAPWLIGSLVGAAPALWWLMHLTLPAHGGGGPGGPRWPILSYYVRFVTQPFGFGADYTLGKAFPDFLAWPRLGATPTYLIGALHLVLAAIALAALGRAARTAARQRPFSWRSVFLGREPEGLLINAALWGYGGLLTLITIGPADSHRHYLELVAPLMALWCARLMLAGGPKSRLARLAPVLCAAQLAVSAGLLAYIDQRQVIQGDYGTIYRAQPPPAAAARQGPMRPGGDD